MLKNFWNNIIGFFKGEQWKKAKQIAAFIGDLLPYAITGVQLVASFYGVGTPKSVLTVLSILQKLNVPPEEFKFDPNLEYTDAEIQGILMGAARYAIKGDLEKAIQNAGSAGLYLGGKRIKTISDIPDNLINTAVNTAYSYLKAEISEK